MHSQFQEGEIFDHQSGIDHAVGGGADGSLFYELKQALAMAEQAPRGPVPLGAFASLVLAWRCKIDEIFEHAGFAAAPAWDIVLGLYQAQATGISLTLTDVVGLTPSPRQTTVRWLTALEDMQLVEQVMPADGSADPEIALTDHGRRKAELALRLRL